MIRWTVSTTRHKALPLGSHPWRRPTILTNEIARRSHSTSSIRRSSSTSFVKLIGGGAALTTLGGLAFIYNEFEGTEGLLRSLSFYSVAIPAYVNYRFHSYRGSPEHVFDELNRVTSKQGADKIAELQGWYVKAGQLCANNIGNAFPEVWQSRMAVFLVSDC